MHPTSQRAAARRATRHTRRRARAVLLAVGLAGAATACSGGSSSRPASSAPATTSGLSAQVAAATDEQLASDAYVAGYPLVVSVRTMQRLGGLVGRNRLYWQTALAGPDSRVIVAPNRDTLYSVAVLDLRAGPLALTLPAITDRYFTYQFLDAWTDSFAYVGTRATQGRAGTWVVTPPGWHGRLPSGSHRLSSPTEQVMLLGRFLVADQADIPAVLSLRDRVRLQPLSDLVGGPGPTGLPPLGSPAGTAQDIPRDASFFTELNSALAANPPPTPAQRSLFERAKPLGIGAGAPGGAGPAATRALLDRAAADGRRRITEAVRASAPKGGWQSPSPVGTYGDDIVERAVVAGVGWGANIPAEAVYPIARTDSQGRALDGSHRYRIRFAKGALPPVKAFWSLSVYGDDLFFVPSPTGRYTIGDRTPGLVTRPDGALDIVVSASAPGPAEAPQVNWLPAPAGGFVLMLRLYLPGPAVLDGTWRYPTIERLD